MDREYEKIWATEYGIESELSVKLEDLVKYRKRYFHRMISNRYKEMLPTIFSYQFSSDIIDIDFIKMEIMLRNLKVPAIGMCKDGKIRILGEITNYLSDSSPANLSKIYTRRTEKDIYFYLPDEYRLDKMSELTSLYNNGNFFAVLNKSVTFNSDYQIIEYYSRELAEISASRFSLILQAKFQTLFRSEYGDESINQIISAIYEGSPFLKLTEGIDFDDIGFHIENPELSGNLQLLKNEYQNKVSELNNIIGINSLAVDKESGVSDAEAKSNNAFTTGNANIYLKTRQRSFDLCNKYLGTNIKVVYDDNAISELGVESEVEEVE